MSESATTAQVAQRYYEAMSTGQGHPHRRRPVRRRHPVAPARRLTASPASRTARPGRGRDDSAA